MNFQFGRQDGEIFEAAWDNGTLKLQDAGLADAIDRLVRDNEFVAASPLGPFVEAGLGTRVQAYATIMQGAKQMKYFVISQPYLSYGIEPESLGG